MLLYSCLSWTSVHVVKQNVQMQRFYCFALQAEDFNESVQVVREWLPHAESELKFRPLPEDEEAIVQLIEHHEVGSLDMSHSRLLSH